VPAAQDVPVLNAGAVGDEPVTPALTKQRMFAGYVGLSARAYRLTSDVPDDMKTTLVGLNNGAKNI
jgi:hypothetical protein